MSEENMIEQSASRLFSQFNDGGQIQRVEEGDFPADLWAQVEESGFGLALAREPIGFGLSMEEVFPILRELGYWNAPVPLAETMAGAAVLERNGIEVPSGPGSVAEQGPMNSLVLSPAEGCGVISGSLKTVPWGRHVSWLLVSLPQGRMALLDMTKRDGVEIGFRNDVAGMPNDTVTFHEVQPVAILDEAPTLGSSVRVLGAAVHCGMMVGALERSLEQAVQYATERSQFGRPIGRNQAIQQQLAYVAGEVASARMATLAALADYSLDEPESAQRTVFGVAAAKVLCGEAAGRTAAVAHQVLGAIGFTREHSLQLSTRRLWSWRERFGADAWWASVLGQAAIRSGPEGFWPAITQREFSANIALSQQ